MRSPVIGSRKPRDEYHLAPQFRRPRESDISSNVLEQLFQERALGMRW